MSINRTVWENGVDPIPWFQGDMDGAPTPSSGGRVSVKNTQISLTKKIIHAIRKKSLGINR